MTKRLQWVDVAKCITIYLVVLAHMFLENQWLWSYIYSFHMPLFFLISGMLHKDDSFKTVVSKSTKRLLVPYAFFFCISYVWWIYFAYIRNSSGMYPPVSVEGCIMKPLLGMLLGNLHHTSYSYSTNVALWFLIALFEMKILMTVFLRVKTLLFKYLLICLWFVATWFVVQCEMELIYSLSSMLKSLPYFFAGYYIKGIISEHNLSDKPMRAVAICVLSVFVSAYGNTLLMNAEIGSPAVRYLFSTLLAPCGILMLVSFSMSLSPLTEKGMIARSIRYISDNTLSIMGIHILFNGTMSGFVKIVLDVNTSAMPLPIALGIASCSMIGSLIFAAFMNKYSPTLIGVIKK